jgi:uncharacterized DUF497 family protein
MHFSWDETKNIANKNKHKISFETAKYVFFDHLHISRQDRVENGEERWQTIGMVNGVLLLLVAHTVSSEDTGEHIRIISARPVTKYERAIYEKGE